jgi:glutaminyl-peptide cyclotransferase
VQPLTISPMRLRPFLLLAAVATPLTGACDAAASERARTAFSGKDALGYATAQVAFGPRVPGTPAARKAGDWIVEQMRLRADTVIVQEWRHVTRQGDTLPLRNILARFNPAARERILYVTHWDTRPTADADPVLGNKVGRFDGAVDGASGVGLFVALGDLLKKTPPTTGVDLLFVDGEDWGDFSEYGDGAAADVLIGSTWFAKHLPEPGYKPVFGVLFDMIGDAELNILKEGHSVQRAPEVVARVWGVANELGYSKYFVPSEGGPVTDDHLPLLDAGLRVIDVIDSSWEYRVTKNETQSYHHTTMDTIDKLSEKSLQVVGDVAVKLLGGT